MIIEAAFMLYRTMLPLPLWCQYYEVDKDASIFVGVYLCVKAMVMSTHARRLSMLLKSLFLRHFEAGRLATPSEVLEAGNPECSICYDTMTTPLVLPCQHMFCAECADEWFEKHTTCPLCRMEVTTVRHPAYFSSGGTSMVPYVV